jgi:hypothetical protein
VTPPSSRNSKVSAPPGRCEKIDLEKWSNFGPEKNRTGMPYKRPLARAYIRLRRNFSQIDFFTSTCPLNYPSTELIFLVAHIGAAEYE